ncbi:MAG: c-type cytochrome biogenesis protein CcsB [Mycobacteriales bacterium]
MLLAAAPAVQTGPAHLSDALFTTSIAIYSLAVLAFAGEYAFARRAIEGQTRAAAPQRELAAVNVPAGATATRPIEPDPPRSGSAAALGTRAAGAVGGEGSGISHRFGRAALGLTLVGALIHLSSIATRALAVDRVPWGNMYEFTSTAGLVAVVAFLAVVQRQPQLRRLGLFLLSPVVVLMFLAGTVFYAKAAPLVPALQSYWLAIHIAAMILATGLFLVSNVATVLYLVRVRYDERTAAGRTLRFPATLGPKLPPAKQLDLAVYRTVAFGFPIFTFGTICGAIWAESAWGRYWGWDPKETWAFIAWVCYAAYLHARATGGWKGKAAARINLVGFAAMLFNFFIVNIVISGLHSYAGLS